MQEIFLQWSIESKERRAEVLEENRKNVKRKSKPPRVRKQAPYSEDALERMDQRRWEKQRAMEGTLAPRQAEMLTDYSKGLKLYQIAMKYRVTMGTVVNQLQNIRNRLDTINNVHSVRVALQKGLIK